MNANVTAVIDFNVDVDGSRPWALRDQLITATLLQLQKQAQERGPPQVKANS